MEAREASVAKKRRVRCSPSGGSICGRGGHWRVGRDRFEQEWGGRQGFYLPARCWAVTGRVMAAVAVRQQLLCWVTGGRL